MWGVCIEKLGKYEEALEKYQKIIDRSPNSVEAEKSRNSIEKVNENIHIRAIKEKIHPET